MNVGCLCNRHTQVAITCEPEEVSSNVAELTRPRGRKRIDLVRGEIGQQPSRGITMDMEHVGRAARAIRNRADDAAQRVVIGVREGGCRTAALNHAEAADLPTADNTIQKSVCALSPTLAMAEGKFVD